MSVQLTDNVTEVERFRDYLAKRLENGGDELTIDRAVADFREYQRQLADLRAKVREAEASLARGEGAPLDADALKSEITVDLLKEGIID